LFFNRYLTEGLKPKVLQSAGTNAKEKKLQGPMSKLSESAATKHTFKPSIYLLDMNCDMFNDTSLTIKY